MLSGLLAEAVGFEPTGRFTGQTISSRSRYDHFDTPPCRKYSVFGTDNMISSQPRYDHSDTAANITAQYKKHHTILLSIAQALFSRTQVNFSLSFLKFVCKITTAGGGRTRRPPLPAVPFFTWTVPAPPPAPGGTGRSAGRGSPGRRSVRRCGR